jgi:hypothetical protein
MACSANPSAEARRASRGKPGTRLAVQKSRQRGRPRASGLPPRKDSPSRPSPAPSLWRRSARPDRWRTGLRLTIAFADMRRRSSEHRHPPFGREGHRTAKLKERPCRSAAPPPRHPCRAPARSERERSGLLRAHRTAAHPHLLLVATVATASRWQADRVSLQSALEPKRASRGSNAFQAPGK